jgi:hypothetical protein
MWTRCAALNSNGADPSGDELVGAMSGEAGLGMNAGSVGRSHEPVEEALLARPDVGLCEL